jgi:hypothetical protein
MKRVPLESVFSTSGASVTPIFLYEAFRGAITRDTPVLPGKPDWICIVRTLPPARSSRKTNGTEPRATVMEMESYFTKRESPRFIAIKVLSMLFDLAATFRMALNAEKVSLVLGAERAVFMLEAVFVIYFLLKLF